jgi:hypothetical protein
VANVSALLAELEAVMREVYPTITFGLGEKDLARNDSGPPRVVWIPTQVTHGPPRKEKSTERRILTRDVTVVAHCWAADTTSPSPLTHYDACEKLVQDLLVKLHKSAWGSIRMGGEEWAQSSHADQGHAALLTFVASVPVEARTYQTVQITALQPDIAGSIAGDSQVDWAET